MGSRLSKETSSPAKKSKRISNVTPSPAGISSPYDKIPLPDASKLLPDASIKQPIRNEHGTESGNNSEPPRSSRHLYAYENPYTRFLRISRRSDGIIDCKLSIKRLRDGCPFRALSYTWGDDSHMKEIRLNGRPFQVRENLWQALESLLAISGGSNFWIDALCIDQNNVLERSQQVQIMDTIFSTAEDVIVWLGPGHSNLHTAVTTMQAHKPVYPSTKDLEALTPQAMDALKTLFTEPYWTRMWIVQEFVVAKDMLFLYGDFNFSWNDLRRTMLYLDESPVAIYCQQNNSAAVKNAYQCIRESSAFSIYRTRKLYKTLASFQLEDLVITYHKQHCADSRDKIFALLGLARWTEIKADYNIDKAKLMEMVLLNCSMAMKMPIDEFSTMLGEFLHVNVSTSIDIMKRVREMRAQKVSF